MIFRMAAILTTALAMTGCVPEPEISGRQTFLDNCSVCHGTDARGTGPMAASLDPPPPDLTGLSARNGGIFPRDHVMSMIDGYSRGAHSGSAMPIFGDGDLGDTIIVENADGTGTPVPAVLLALADYLESVQD